MSLEIEANNITHPSYELRGIQKIIYTAEQYL